MFNTGLGTELAQGNARRSLNGRIFTTPEAKRQK
jgi:hypothetical protein